MSGHDVRREDEDKHMEYLIENSSDSNDIVTYRL